MIHPRALPRRGGGAGHHASVGRIVPVLPPRWEGVAAAKVRRFMGELVQRSAELIFDPP